MKPSLSNQVWRAALALCAVFTLVAALALGSCTKPAATLEALQSVRSVQSLQMGSAAPSVPVKRARPAEQFEAVAAISPSTDVADVGSLNDLSRLRARRLTLPLPDVSAAQLTDNYTQSRAVGVTHEALDIMAPRGTPVLAVDDGRVVKLFLSKRGGITLYQFDPGAEYVYYYAHLDRYADGVTEGDNVRKGQIIGYVGSTGNALPDAPHLHFAILRLDPERQWWRGTAINPFLVWRNATP